jgi:pyruvate-formate lyase-activating enzyme
MSLKVGSQEIYSSTFDPKTGIIVRSVEMPADRYGGIQIEDRNLRANKAFEKRYPHRWRSSFSPVPETIDVSITDRCPVGCQYCYQDSKPGRAHAPRELVETILKGFEQAPYQIAIGGGEPTIHPDFEYILRRAKQLGTVPNYTTAGINMTESIIATTNEVCGGLAMTYHAFKGLDWFCERYAKLKDQIKVQLNVHLIADKDVAKNLRDLISRYDDIGPLRLVLLAYYPEVGRSTLDSLITKRVYMKDFPEALKLARENHYQIAFSEGLLAYFLSRPELHVETRFAMRSEGAFSCYFDPTGAISDSSFDPPPREGRTNDVTAFTVKSQKMWDELYPRSYSPGGDACGDCRNVTRCATPTPFHYGICAYAPHNKIPLHPVPEPPPPVPRTAYERILDDEE